MKINMADRAEVPSLRNKQLCTIGELRAILWLLSYYKAIDQRPSRIAKPLDDWKTEPEQYTRKGKEKNQTEQQLVLSYPHSVGWCASINSNCMGLIKASLKALISSGPIWNINFYFEFWICTCDSGEVSSSANVTGVSVLLCKCIHTLYFLRRVYYNTRFFLKYTTPHWWAGKNKNDPSIIDCCNRCQQSPGNYTHMFWSCPNLSNCWSQVSSAPTWVLTFAQLCLVPHLLNYLSSHR